jgi:hypothetical protein
MRVSFCIIKCCLSSYLFVVGSSFNLLPGLSGYAKCCSGLFSAVLFSGVVCVILLVSGSCFVLMRYIASLVFDDAVKQREIS